MLLFGAQVLVDEGRTKPNRTPLLALSVTYNEHTIEYWLVAL